MQLDAELIDTAFGEYDDVHDTCAGHGEGRGGGKFEGGSKSVWGERGGGSSITQM